MTRAAPAPCRMPDAALEALVAAAAGRPLALARLAQLTAGRGDGSGAIALAREALALGPRNGEVRALALPVISAGVPGWHFGIVRDAMRNAAYDAALRRAVRPDTRALDIGAGTGLLAMMAARAGARAVVSCEMNPVVADAAAEIVGLNGFADRIRVMPKSSADLDADTDLGGRVDLIVSEIVSNNLLGEAALPVMQDVVPRLLKPGGQVIPSHGQVRVALAYHPEGMRPMDRADGFDLRPFNRLAAPSRKFAIGDPALALRSAPATLFDFDFQSGGPYRDGAASIEVRATGGPANGVVQWIRLQMDAQGAYENRPEPGAASCWSCVFHGFDEDLDPAPGDLARIHGAHELTNVRIWMDASRQS